MRPRTSRSLIGFDLVLRRGRGSPAHDEGTSNESADELPEERAPAERCDGTSPADERAAEHGRAPRCGTKARGAARSQPSNSAAISSRPADISSTPSGRARRPSSPVDELRRISVEHTAALTVDGGVPALIGVRAAPTPCSARRRATKLLKWRSRRYFRATTCGMRNLGKSSGRRTELRSSGATRRRAPMARRPSLLPPSLLPGRLPPAWPPPLLPSSVC